MKRFEVNTTVQVELASADSKKLGISKGYYEEGEIRGHYPLGHYVRMPDSRVLAIADRYNALKQVRQRR